MKKIITILIGMVVCTIIVLNFTVSLKSYETNSLSVKLLAITAVAEAEDPQPLDDYEDQYCDISGKVGCCPFDNHTCETGILCNQGGCG